MSTPEPTTQDLAERVARVCWERTGIGVAWEHLPGRFQDESVTRAADYLDAVRAAGLAVVQLPEVVVTEQRLNGAACGVGFKAEVPSPDGRGWRVTAQHVPGYHEDSIVIGEQSWRSVEDVERDAARLFVAARWLRAQRQGGEHS